MHVVFFDGVCGLCHHTVQFLLKNDRHDRLRFAPLQSEFARTALPPLGIDPSKLDSVVVVADRGEPTERAYARSRAVLFAMGELGGMYAPFKLLLWVPSFLLDPFYAIVAKTRYRLFGKRDACAVPSAEDRAKFLAINADEGAA